MFKCLQELLNLQCFSSQGIRSTGNVQGSSTSTALGTPESSDQFYKMMAIFSSLQKPVPPWIFHLTSMKQILVPVQDSGTSVVASKLKEPGAYSTKAFMGRSLAQCYVYRDTSRASNLYIEAPETGKLLSEVKSCIPFRQLLLILLMWSSLLFPDKGKPNFAGVRKVLKYSDTTVPGSPSANPAPNYMELVPPAVKTLVVRPELHIYSSTDTCKVSALSLRSSRSGLQLRELISSKFILQGLLVLLYRSFALQRRL